MTQPVYSQKHIEDILIRQKLPPSYRIFPAHHLRTPLGTASGDSQFCIRTGGYTLLYTSPDFATTFIETVVRDRFIRKKSREVLLKEVTGRAWVCMTSKPRSKLKLLDLRGDGCIRLGAPTDAVNARSHGAGRTLGQVIYSEHKEIDGLLFSSRLTSADVFVIFDRAIQKIHSIESGKLQDHPELCDTLSKYNIQLITS